MTTGRAYTYKALSLYFRASRVETIMFMGAQHSWFRRVAAVAAALAMSTGTFAQSATAQVYPGYSSGSQVYPGYSSGSQAYPGYSPGSQAYPGYSPGSQAYPG